MSKRLWSDVQVESEGQGQTAGSNLGIKPEQNGDAGGGAAVASVKKTEEEDARKVDAVEDEMQVDKDEVILNYDEGHVAEKLAEMMKEGKSGVKIKISPKYMTNTQPMVKSRQLWGDRTYTYDSDVVPVLIHQGFYRNLSERPPEIVVEVQCVLTFQPGQTYYPSATRNRLCSRPWACSSGCEGSFSVESCCLVKEDNGKVQLTANPNRIRFQPTFAPASFDRVMNTRSTTASAERRQRYVPEVAFMFNLCNEPWRKYFMHTIADRGLKQWQWTSARLHSEVLYLETARERFELSWTEEDTNGQAGDTEKMDSYRWSKCRRPLSQSAMKEMGAPLPLDAVITMHAGLKWQDIKWGPASVEVLGKTYAILRIHFMQRGQSKGDSQSSS
ncbi:hypothetical protein BSKO_03703 [Bryopsis sp. KO-2023]|nr:hypothetical protein BSKO_03703 [Bryopsis sp. KO-2023]